MIKFALFSISLIFVLSCSTTKQIEIKKDTPIAISKDTLNERKISSEDSWSFIVLSDLHLRSSKGDTEKNVEKLIPEIIKLNPKFVILNGDSSVGNPGDKNPNRPAMWWKNIENYLAPIFDAKIAVFPIAGNHDYYTSFQKTAFINFLNRTLQRNLAMFDSDTKLLKKENENDYEISYRNVRFEMLHVPFQDSSSKTHAVEWMLENLPSKDVKKTNEYIFAFGHVPFFSVFSSSVYYNSCNIKNTFTNNKPVSVVDTMIQKGVDVYFAGHEHFMYDIDLLSKDHDASLRQVTVSTSSGSTLDAPVRSAVLKHCQRNNKFLSCLSPSTRLKFSLSRIYKRDKETNEVYSPGYEQQQPLGFVIVNVEKDKYSIEFKTLNTKTNEIVNFN